MLIGFVAVFTLASCKKDNSDAVSIPSGSNVIPIPPPFGFTFPRTYNGYESELYKGAWVNDVDISSKINIRTYLDLPADLLIGDIQVVLQDRKTLKLIGPDGYGGKETSEFGYYFYSDSLWIITKLPFADTIPFAKGNYDGFNVTQTRYRVTGMDDFTYKANDGGMNGVNSKEFITQYILSGGRFNTIDSLIIYANKFTLE